MPLFKAIQKLVTSSTQTFFWLGAHGMIENAYQELFTPELSELYLTDFYGRRQLEAWPGIQKMAVMPTAEVVWCLGIPGIDRTRSYNRITGLAVTLDTLDRVETIGLTG